MAEDGAESRARIMDATYRALVETGYADLTMNDIAAESETSTSLLHYHFDTKEDLLVAFLDHIVEGLAERFAEAAEEEPTVRLYEILSPYILHEEETERASFHVALVELRGQAPYNERYRARFREADELLHDTLEDAIAAGVESGAFEPVEPAELATLLIATVDGGRTRGVGLGDPTYIRRVLAALTEYVLADVLTPEAAATWEALIGR